MAAFGGHHLVLAARTYVYNTYISEFFLKKINMLKGPITKAAMASTDSNGR
jgi:hypothetical protein